MIISLQELATKRRWTNLDSIPDFSWGEEEEYPLGQSVSWLQFEPCTYRIQVRSVRLEAICSVLLLIFYFVTRDAYWNHVTCLSVSIIQRF
jgi:hypothetical protein